MSAPLPFRGHSIQALCEKDLLVSFYDSEEDRTLTLLRTPVYEPLLPPEERGVRCTLAGKELGYLAGAAWDARGVRLRMRDGRAVEVEAHRADQASLQRSMLVMELMNFDGSLELTGITATDEIRVDMLLQRLDSEDPSTVRSALREAHAAREMMTEPMLEIVTGLEPASDDDDNLPSLAFYLLASWREPRGLEPLVQFLEKYGEDAVEELGDVVLQDGPRLLAAMACGNFAPVRRLVESPGASVWARIAAMTSLTIAAASGEIAASEVETYLESLATRGILGTNVGLWSELAAQAADLGSSRLLPLVEQAWQEKRVDPSVVGLKEIRADVARGQKAMLAEMRKRQPLDRVLDPVAMTSWWSFFQPELPYRRRSSNDEDEPYQSPFMSDLDDVIVPVRTGPKIGRNEPCPCGSGKKYKKCCGA